MQESNVLHSAHTNAKTARSLDKCSEFCILSWSSLHTNSRQEYHTLVESNPLRNVRSVYTDLASIRQYSHCLPCTHQILCALLDEIPFSRFRFPIALAGLLSATTTCVNERTIDVDSHEAKNKFAVFFDNTSTVWCNPFVDKFVQQISNSEIALYAVQTVRTPFRGIFV